MTAMAGKGTAVVTLPTDTQIQVVPDERIVSTEVYEGTPEGESLNTATFTEVDGRTTLTILVQHQSREHRDAHIASGMETGLQKAMDFLEGVARSLR